MDVNNCHYIDFILALKALKFFFYVPEGQHKLLINYFRTRLKRGSAITDSHKNIPSRKGATIDNENSEKVI